MPTGISADEAVARVVAFVDNPALTADLTADGPQEGAAGSAYEVAGTHLSATVDAESGAVTTLLLFGSASPAPTKPSADDAVATANAFVRQHGIDVEGMTQAVEKVDHGDTWEYVVKWTLAAGDVTLPRSVEIGIDPSGRVFRLAAFERPYGSIPVATIDLATAVAAATVAAFGDTPGVRVDGSELKLKVGPDGAQQLVWEVRLTAPLDMGSEPPLMIDHAWVEVDATTGVATVVGRG